MIRWKYSHVKYDKYFKQFTMDNKVWIGQSIDFVKPSKRSFCRFSLHMIKPIFIAVACNVVMSMDGLAKLDEDSEFNVLDFLDKNSRQMYAAASISARKIVKKHSEPIDEYMGLFDYPIQAANGCITGNKLRGFDPVECIRMITDPVEGKVFFHDLRRHAFTNAQLEILIFNSIEIGNIPVLDALLRIRSSKGAIELTFLQDAICWASISQTLHRAPDDRSFDFTTPRSIDDLLLNDICNLLVNFSKLNGNAIILSISVTLDMIAQFHLRLVKSNRVLTNYFFQAPCTFANFKHLLSLRPFPTSHLALYRTVNVNQKPASWVGKLLEMGMMIQERSICTAVNFLESSCLKLYLKSGMRVNWDDEMKCIAKHVSTSTYKSVLISMSIKELDRQYLPKKAPFSIYHGLKCIGWLIFSMNCIMELRIFNYRRWLV